MESHASRSSNGVPFRSLSLDLEADVVDRRIRAFAGIRSDRRRPLVFPAMGGGLASALAKLDHLSEGAEFTLGHNLIAFDLPILRAVNPELRMLRLPAVDTLRLNPLAFPRNPYHRLVKDYQDGELRRGRINDPELDARLTLQVCQGSGHCHMGPRQFGPPVSGPPSVRYLGSGCAAAGV